MSIVVTAARLQCWLTTPESDDQSEQSQIVKNSGEKKTWTGLFCQCHSKDQSWQKTAKIVQLCMAIFAGYCPCAHVFLPVTWVTWVATRSERSGAWATVRCDPTLDALICVMDVCMCEARQAHCAWKISWWHCDHCPKWALPLHCRKYCGSPWTLCPFDKLWS